MTLILDCVHAALTTLGLSEVDALLETHLERAVKDGRTYAECVCDLLEAEIDARSARVLQARMGMAGFPYAKSLSQFNFGFQPSIDERQARALQTLRFVQEASTVMLLGPPGVGKTHVAVGVASEAIRGGFRAYFATAYNLGTALGTAARDGKLDTKVRTYLTPNVLVVDEVGYLPLDEVGATIFFQLVSARYERGSIILTSNTRYADWGGIFGKTTIATAILDRRLHHSTTINIRGESYRLRERRNVGLLAPAQLDGQTTRSTR
jgi:DNA replication protein DnaC